jgi:ubiquinone/menaquinone biosynthesis C-methylase UbiE
MTGRPPQTNFDRVARVYRWMEYATFGSSLESCRNRFLSEVRGCGRALLLGDGDGRFTARLLQENLRVTADAVDSSNAMLDLLRRRINRAGTGGRLHTYHADVRSFSPQGSYDLVVTHFFLDCLSQPELDELGAQILRHAERNALWVVSEFRIPAGPMGGPARLLVRMLYLAFRLFTGLRVRALPDQDTSLRRTGFTRIAQHLSLGGLLSSELWQRGEYTPAMLPPQAPRTLVPDPLPDPEPASPSLPEPDPGIYHREPGTTKAEPSDEGSCD